MAPEIAKMLVLSTGHLTPHACNSFLPGYRHAYEKSDYGWFVFVPTDETPIEDGDELPGCLIDCLKFADTQGCQWVMFDQDGPREDSLPYYEW